MATEQEQAAVIRELGGTVRPVVVDLGANQAEEFCWINKSIGPLSRYIAVEPDPRNAAVIRASSAHRAGFITLLGMAIAGKCGKTILHLADNNAGQAKVSSSIHQPTGHLTQFPWCSFEHQVEVHCWTLDHLKAVCDLRTIDLLWVDIQGAERDMIEGGLETLKIVRYLMIEAEETEFYEGQALKPELLALLPGFEVVEDFGYNVLLKRKVG